MSSVTATINVQINAANAAAQLTALQGKVASMNKGMLAATAGGVMAQEKAIKRMGNVLGSSGMFTTGIRNVHTELGRMHQEFDRGSTTLQKYRQNSKMWGKDHSAINRLAADRVRMLQSQYVALGKEMNGVQKAMQIKPTGMMREFGADAMYATQQQMLFRRNLQMGSTALVNWGKNTQWAGRQMMVGMGIPIAIMAAGAIRSFNDIEKSSIAFKRVYGDTTTTVAEKSQMLAKVQQTVGKEMLKYGVSMADTLDMSARAAATGAKGADLIAATRETMRLATLGNMDYNKSLDAVIAMQTAFNIKSSDMAKTTDFLNAVENQTILSMQDMAVAVPRVAPVIKGLGGNVQDLAVMMTALRQGGVSAEQGANALKSGLGSLLNPTSTAIKQFDGLGINLQKIVDTNKGDIIGTLQGLGKALDGLTKYDRQRALEGLFGKYQYSRMGALLKNINSKAAKETMKLAKTNAGELARMSNQELSQISDSPMIKLKAAIEGIKAAAAPLGAVLSDIAAKILNIATPIVSFFSNNDIAKWALIGTAGIAALAGTFTMVVGVLANFAGSMVKAGMSVKSFFRIITGRGSLAYITSEELEASAAANSLATAAERAGQGLMAESRAAQLLTSQLNALSAAQLKAAGSAGALASAPLAKTAVVTKPDAAASSLIPKVGHAELATMQRSHLGGMVALSESQIREVMAYQGISPKIRSALENAIQNGIPVTGGNARSIYLPEAVNQALGRKGMQATALAEQLAAQGRNMTMAPLMQVIGRNTGLSHKDVGAWATSGAGAPISSAIYDRLHAEIAARGSEMIRDSDIQPMADRIISDVAAQHGEKIQEAVRKSGMISRVAIDGQGAQSVGDRGKTVGAQYDSGLGADKDRKLDARGVQFEQHQAFTHVPPKGASTLNPTMGSTPPNIIVTDKSGRVTDMVVPQSDALRSPASRVNAATSAASKSYRFAGGLQPPTPTKPISEPSQRVTSRRSFTGNGMMGIGMLASTAMMGMEMAGKQVPMAAQFAANGLMGVGMAAQMMPDAFAKLATPLMRVVSALGPLGIAVGATAAVVAGSALIWRTLNQKWRRDGWNLGQATTDATQAIDETGQIFNKTGIVQRQIAKEQGATEQAMSTGQQFLESEVGKRWLDDYAKTAGEVGVANATGSFASKLATSVVNGVMDSGDVKGVIAALSKENAVMAAGVRADFLKLVGGSMKNIDPFAASLAVNKQNEIQSNALIAASRQRIEQAKQASSTQWSASGYGTTTGAVAGRTMQQGVNIRALMQENAGLAAGAWSGTIATAFQNRLAAEAQLAQMIEARDRLANKKDRTASETKQMNNLTKQIQGGTTAIATMDKQVHKTMDGLENLYNSPGTDRGAMQQSIFESIGQNDNKMVRLAGAMLEGSDIADQRIKFTMSVALESGMLQPESLMNMFNQFGSAQVASEKMELAINTVGTAPAMDFFNSMATFKTGVQTRALQSFGAEFSKIAINAKLSAKEAVNLARALSGGNLSKAQEKQIRVSVKAGKVEDPGSKIKANRNISVGANTQAARNRIEALRKEAEKVSGKKINIKASDNAGEVIRRLRRIIATADDVGSKKPKVKVDADTHAAEQKARNVEAALSKGNPPPIPITAVDKTTAVSVAVQAQLVAMQAANRPLPITAVDAASPVISSVSAMLDNISGKTVHTYVVTHHKDAAAGGMYVGYASGGVHRGDGKVRGPGGPTDDKVNAHLSDGEYVIKASSVEKYGVAFMSAINRGVYKGGFAKGSPGVPIKGSLPPKESDGNSRAAQFGNDYRNVMFEADNIVKEFRFFGNIMKDARKLLGKNFKSMGYEFTKYIVDNFDPKQIQKMFGGKKDVGAKKIRKQYQTEQKYAALDEAASAAASARGSRGISQLLAKELKAGAGVSRTSAITGMSPEQFQSYKAMGGKNRNRYLDNLAMTQRAQIAIQEAADKRQRLADTKKAYKNATGKNLLSVMGNQGLDAQTATKYADALGMSMEELAQQIEDNTLPKNFAAIGEAAVKASKAMEILAMTAEERTTQKISNNDQKISNLQSLAAAKGRQGVADKFGKSQSVLEAESAVREAQNAIAQGQIDDINEKYDRQLNLLDQIGQHQQAIANLERGRMSVANALSQGDIAAAATAAQQQRNDMAQFARDQMRNQLENQQKAQTMLLQDQINERSRINRDIQNQIALITAQANLEQADAIGNIQAQSDGWMTAAGYVDAMNAALETQNGLLSQTVAQLQAAVAAQAQIIPDMPKSDIAPPISGTVGGVVKAAVKSGKKGKKGRAFGGFIPGVGNSDSVPTMLTPGEFVVRKAAAAKFGPMLKDMNYGSFQTGDAIGGGNVKIDNVVFNINGANLNEREVADIAVRKMHSLNSATIRGGRF